MPQLSTFRPGPGPHREGTIRRLQAIMLTISTLLFLDLPYSTSSAALTGISRRLLCLAAQRSCCSLLLLPGEAKRCIFKHEHYEINFHPSFPHRVWTRATSWPRFIIPNKPFMSLSVPSSHHLSPSKQARASVQPLRPSFLGVSIPSICYYR